MPPRQAGQGKAEAAPRAWILKGALDRLERRYAEIRAARNFPNRRFDSGFDTPGDRVVVARVPSLLPKPGWCMLRKNFGRGASCALKPAWLGCASQCSLQR